MANKWVDAQRRQGLKPRCDMTEEERKEADRKLAEAAKASPLAIGVDAAEILNKIKPVDG